MQTRPNLSDDQFEYLVNSAIAAVKGNDLARAQRWLVKAIHMRPGDTRPWFWLSATTNIDEEKRTFLERAVAADPANAAARRGLAYLSEKLDKSRLLDEGQSPSHPPGNGQVQSASLNFSCPACGSRLAFNTVKVAMDCPSCGYTQAADPRAIAEAAEQPMDYFLPTTRAHRWAENQQHVSCQSCGALTLLPPEQRSDHCPYCGSNRMSVSTEQVEFLDPQAILLMKINEEQAAASLRHWLTKGLLLPDNLQLEAKIISLRTAYYPFWTFNGTLELPWRCEVNISSGRSSHWVPRSGTEYKFFDDILVPGIQALDSRDIEAIQPFNLGELVEFLPEYLAGWPALNYDLPLADASLLARQKVVQQLRSQLYHEIEPGQEKRNIDTGAGKWSGMTFKHILLPLWVGVYEYQHKKYQFLMNGQTGKITGSRPRDYVKLSLYLILVATAAAVALFMLFWLANPG